MGNDGEDLRGIARPMRERLRDRIVQNVAIDREHGCWLWVRQKNNQGYPRMNVRLADKDGRLVHTKLAVHRVSLAVFVRPPRPGEEGAHKPECCPYKACCNPAHLKWATREENEADKRHPRRIRLPEERIFAPAAREQFA